MTHHMEIRVPINGAEYDESDPESYLLFVMYDDPNEMVQGIDRPFVPVVKEHIQRMMENGAVRVVAVEVE